MNVQKSQSEAESSFAVALGVLHRQVEKQPTSAVLTFLSTLIWFGQMRWEGWLAPIPSLLEGVKIYYATCAASTLVHYTPPPFDERIVQCFLVLVKSLLKIALESW